MIVSALIDQCRREFGDVKKSTQSSRDADGSSTLFNLGKKPVIENSYSVTFGGTAKSETTDYTIDLDSGDLQTVAVQNNGVNIKANYKYANFRDRNWIEAINYGIDKLSSKGFTRQTVRDSSSMALSANIRVYDGPSNAIDLYEVLQSSSTSVSGTPQRLPGNWSYQTDANKLVLGFKPSVARPLFVSYLRKLNTYSAASATIDVKDEWVELVKKAAGEYYYRHMAGKIAQQGNANIDEGHFSFTNLRTMANTLRDEFDVEAIKKKPPLPAKEVQFHVGGGGIA